MSSPSAHPWQPRQGFGILAAILLATATATAPAFAAVTTFYGLDPASGPGARPNSDAAHADFLAALAGPSIGVEDFEDETVGPVTDNTPFALEFAGTPITGNLLTLSSFGGGIEGANTPGLFGSSGTRFLEVGAGGTETYFSLTFSTPVTAFGFYGSSVSNYQGFGNFAPSAVRLDGGAAIDVVNVLTGTIPGDSANFFGLVSDTPFTSLTLFNPAAGTTDGIGMDDITVSVVPAPPALVLLLSGVLGLVGYRARGRRRGTLLR